MNSNPHSDNQTASFFQRRSTRYWLALWAIIYTLILIVGIFFSKRHHYYHHQTHRRLTLFSLQHHRLSVRQTPPIRHDDHLCRRLSTCY